MPLETPPSRVKKAWRSPGMAASSDDPNVMRFRLPAPGGSSLKPATDGEVGSVTASTLNIDPMPPRPLSVSRFSAAEMSAETSGVVFRHQRDGPRLDAEPLEELALRHRAMDARADILSRARQRLEIDMCGDVGMARILQRIGEAVPGDGLEGVAGVAAQMAVIDDQRRAVLVAHPRGDRHDLGIRPPFEHGADRGCAHQRRQQHLEARHRLVRDAECQPAIGIEVDDAFVPAGLALDRLMDRQHIEIFVGENDRGAFRHIVDAVMPGEVAHARSVVRCFSRSAGLISTRWTLKRLIERRQHADRAQRVRHHGAAAGAEFDQPQRRRRAHRLPDRRRP